jgi:multicomponent Na+:H+ antiporter subunit C
MALLHSILLGVLFAVSFYLMMRRSMVKVLLGLMLFSNAVNLLVFTAAGVTRWQPPLIPEGADLPPMPHADPLPQALVLTAIVIGLGLLSFVMALIYRTYRNLGTDDLNALAGEDEE